MRKRNSIAEIEALVARLRMRRNGNRKAVLEEITTAFEPLVQAQAVRYAQSVIGAEHEELVQVARVGLLESCYTFDRKKGAFPTHAVWGIRRALAAYVGNLANPVRLPTKLTYRLPKLRRVMITLAQELGREATPEELGSAVGLKPHAIAAMMVYEVGPCILPNNHLVPSEAPSPEEILIAKEEAEAYMRAQEESDG